MSHVCAFKEVYVWIPQKLIKRCFEVHSFLSRDDCKRLQSKKEDLEKAGAQIAHALSVVDRCLIKRADNK
jgi:hypothetical protein